MSTFLARMFILSSFLAPSIVGVAQASAATGDGAPSHAHLQPHAAVHGMLVFGGAGQIYLSHLPMFHPVHQFQAVMQASLGAEAEKIYAEEKSRHPEETIYTLVPEPFVLPEMIAQPHPFQATLYRGHFERGGVPIAKIAAVNLTKILFFKPLNAQEEISKEPAYLYFGAGAESFLVHVIEGEPGFDQILAAHPTAPVEAGVMAKVIAPAQLPSGSGAMVLRNAVDGKPIQLESTTQLYLETGDLE